MSEEKPRVVVTIDEGDTRIAECPDTVDLWILDYTLINEKGTPEEEEVVDAAIARKDWPEVSALLQAVEERVYNVHNAP